jgi:hypothetical protein
VVSDPQEANDIAMELEILGLSSENRVGVDEIPFSQVGVPADDGMASQDAAGSQDRIGFDKTVRADFDIVVNPGRRIHNGRRMNSRHGALR